MSPCPGEALLEYRTLLHLPSVHRHHHENLQAWLSSNEGGHGFLHGVEASVYWPEDREDLTSLNAKDGPTDSLTTLIHFYLLPCYHKIFGRRYKQATKVADLFTGEPQSMRIFYYSDRTLLAIVDSISTILASLTPALCTLALFFIKTPLARMGALIAFTVLFSIVLVMVANVKRAECFGIIAAFSAVLVVFVGGNITNSST